MTQSPVAASKDTLRAAEKSPSHSWCRTRAPRRSAISTVRSVEPVSTTTISSTASRAASRQRPSIASSSLTIMHRLMVRPSAGRAAAAMRSTRGCRSRTGPAACGQHAHARALAARALGEVALDVGQLGVQALGGAEQRLGGLDGSELVEDDARVVEQDRLARLGLEHVDGGRGGGQQDRRGSSPCCRRELEQRAARLVAAVGIGDLAGLGGRGRGSRPSRRRPDGRWRRGPGGRRGRPRARPGGGVRGHR